ncbi:MAG TPA: ATP-dependent DNA helicase, partial [Thermoanaerobaculia bacterium]
QAFLDAPVWQTRWRWNTTISLAVPRNRGGKKVPPQLQRTFADDLMAAVFPDAAACFENIGGDRELPDHPLVNQAVRDCLEEAMDFPGLERVLTKIHAGELQLIARDTPEPSSLCNEIINAKPYAFLDDAPLEERRTMSVQTGRSGELDPGAIDRVRDEARPDPRDPDELHDALLTAGLLLEDEVSPELFAPLVAARRAGRVKAFFVAAERLPEVLAIHPCEVNFAPPPSRVRAWSRDEAMVEIVRGRMTVTGPITAAALAATLDVRPGEAEAALLKLESEGVVLRVAHEWCDRRLLARIHRYTLNRLRAEIAPVTPADFQRFLFSWQHVAPAARLAGVEGLQTAIAQLDGFEAAAGAWERHILPARVDGYSPSMLDTLTLSGAVGWARLTPSTTAPIVSTPIALFMRAFGPPHSSATPEVVLSDKAKEIVETLKARGASFARELTADPSALAELVSAGLITSDGFAGLRSLIDKRARPDHAGRWSLAATDSANDDIERIARALLNRYGVIFRRLLTREPNAPPWRDLARHYRMLEMRGDIRGGRFVSGMSGEQFALPQAVEHLREIRRQGDDAALIVISAADPLNLVGILTNGERIRASASTKIAYRNGVAVSAMEGDFLKPLSDVEEKDAVEVATLLAGRKVPVTRGFVGRAN